MAVQFKRGGILAFEDEPEQSEFSRRLDAALLHGGDFAAIAAELGTTVGWIRRHVRRREKSGEWRFDATGGRLVRLGQIARRKRHAQ